jgi:hypothetical protein
MRPELFGNLVRRSRSIESRKAYTLPCSILMHAALAGAVIIAPLVAPGVLPVAPATMAYVAASPAPPPPPPPPRAAAPKALAGRGESRSRPARWTNKTTGQNG